MGQTVSALRFWVIVQRSFSSSFLFVKLFQRAPSEQLFYAYELLDKAIAGMNWNSMLTTLSDGSSTIDHCYVKVRGGNLTLGPCFP